MQNFGERSLSAEMYAGIAYFCRHFRVLKYIYNSSEATIDGGAGGKIMIFSRMGRGVNGKFSATV